MTSNTLLREDDFSLLDAQELSKNDGNPPCKRTLDCASMDASVESPNFLDRFLLSKNDGNLLGKRTLDNTSMDASAESPNFLDWFLPDPVCSEGSSLLGHSQVQQFCIQVCFLGCSSE